MWIQENSTKSKRRRAPVHKGYPAWIVFRAGGHSARLPFENDWAYVLDITSLGFRADREHDAIVITGCPSEEAEVLS